MKSLKIDLDDLSSYDEDSGQVENDFVLSIELELRGLDLETAYWLIMRVQSHYIEAERKRENLIKEQTQESKS